MESFISLLGLVLIVSFGVLISNDRKKIAWKTILSGCLLQLIFALFILKTEIGKFIFTQANSLAVAILGFTNDGSRFLFGDLVDGKFGFIFAFAILPTIIFVSSLMSVLYYWGIMPKIVKAFALVMKKTMNVSGAESLAAAANIFAGQTEAPLVVKPYIDKMTRSEVLSLMTGGMATVAGGVLAAYVGLGVDAGHLLAASVMSAPAALVCAKLLLPEKETSQTAGEIKLEVKSDCVNTIDAAAKGAYDGLYLALNVGAMLLAFIALIALINGGLGWLGGLFGFPQLTFELISGYLFAPVAFILGVPWIDCLAVGELLAKKLVLNEFVAYLELKQMLSTLQPRSIIISTYALCGFANFSSIAIQLGGIGTIAPTQKVTIAQLGVKSLVGGTMACLMTACVAGLFI